MSGNEFHKNVVEYPHILDCFFSLENWKINQALAM